MRVELVTPCSHGMMIAHNAIRLDDGSVIGDTPCPGGSRSTVSGFSPEAVQAVVAEVKHLLRTRPVRGFSVNFSTTDFAEEITEAALAAAWATDFGLPDKTTDEPEV